MSIVLQNHPVGYSDIDANKRLISRHMLRVRFGAVAEFNTLRYFKGHKTMQVVSVLAVEVVGKLWVGIIGS